MKASELDKKFDDNQEDILEHFDTSKIRMINEEPKINNGTFCPNNGYFRAKRTFEIFIFR